MGPELPGPDHVAHEHVRRARPPRDGGYEVGPVGVRIGRRSLEFDRDIGVRLLEGTDQSRAQVRPAARADRAGPPGDRGLGRAGIGVSGGRGAGGPVISAARHKAAVAAARTPDRIFRCIAMFLLSFWFLPACRVIPTIVGLMANGCWFLLPPVTHRLPGNRRAGSLHRYPA